MTKPQHPITPPPELLKKWEDDYFDDGENIDYLLIAAYQAGADQELEACCEWAQGYAECGDSLRIARRSKPPSLAEEALEALMIADGPDHPTPMLYLLPDAAATIRRALERLQELEGGNG